MLKMKLRKNLTQVSTFFPSRLTKRLIREEEEDLSPALPLRGLARVLRGFREKDIRLCV
jgi:hypothetical protein